MGVRHAGSERTGGPGPRSKPKPIRPYHTYARPEAGREPRSWAGLAVRAMILLALAGGAYFFFFYQGTSDDEQIRALVEEGRRLFEAKQLGSFMDLISESYSDRSGLTKQDLRVILLNLFERSHGEPRAEVTSLQVTRSGDDAVIGLDVQVSVVGREGEPRLILGSTAPQPITIRGRKEKGKMGTPGKWRVTWSSGWEGADYQY